MRSKFFHHVRLAGFPLGLGLVSVLVSGTLNRVMIVELGIPAVFVSFLFALPLLISPLRIWLGYRSDGFPLWGLRREPFIILGAFAAGFGLAGATLAVLRIDSFPLLLALGAAVAFILYGFGKNLASNTFEALLADKFTGDQRPRAVSMFKIVMFGGIIGGAILLGRLLEPYSGQRLLTVVAASAALSLVLTVLGTLRQEPRKQTLAEESAAVREVPFAETFKALVWSDPQVRRFFLFLMLTVAGTLGQDVLLEPYAALVLGMSVGETTRMTAVWGAGTLVAMGLAGFWLVKRFGYERVTAWGLGLGVLIFTGLILTGALGMPGLFWALVFLLGVSTGLSAAGTLTASIEFTTANRSGLLMGVWGVAHNLGQALGSLFSGGLVDLTRSLGGSAFTAYGLIFAIEALTLIVTLGMLRRIRVTEARAFMEVRAEES
ncbi:BCD family MFS transporter [bacterium]|nr:BCD family MFS transporter [bacterium]